MTAFRDWWIRADGRPGAVLHDCLSAAVAAPSIHNTQPWQFRLSGSGVDLLADQSRRLAVIDPRGREVLLSVGAALLNLRVAILAHGRQPLTRLLPSPVEPDLAARVTLGPPAPTSNTVRLLAQAIPLRRTNRRPFDTTPIPADVLAELGQAAATEGGYLALADPGTTSAVLSLVLTAEKHQRIDPGYWRELAEWTRQSPHRTDGVPPEAYGPWSAMETVPIRDFGLIEPARRRTVEVFEPEPTIAVLYSSGDTQRDWLMAGQALERTLLTATVRGLATSLMTQPIEVPNMRELLADTEYGRQPQAILRFGYGPPSPATPRRPLEEVVAGLSPAMVVGTQPKVPH
jgi:nitroreductase